MNSRRGVRSFAFVLFVTWATVQGSLSLWGFRQDAARSDFGYLVQSVKTWRESGVLYEDVPRVNLNPPHTSILLFTPLTWVSFDAAVKLWIVLQIVTLISAVVAIARELHLTAHRLEWIVPTVVASSMTSHNWLEGQIGGVLLVVGVVAWRGVRRNRHPQASIALAGLISLKPQLGFILLASGGRTVLRTILVGGAGLVAGVILIGHTAWISWLAIAQARGLQLLPWNVSIGAMLYRSGATELRQCLYVLLAASIVALTWLATRKNEDLDRAWVLWGATALLIAPVAWVYYAAALLGPLISWGERQGWPIPAKIGILLWLLPLQTVSWVTSLPPRWDLGIISSPYTWGTLLLWLSALTCAHDQRDHRRMAEDSTSS